jgi:hypothetical protein
MKEVSNVESTSKFSIHLNVKNRNVIAELIINIKIAVVFGLLSKLKNGPIIVKINPNVEEIKNLGNRNTLSQKSDILINYKAMH